MTFDLGIISLCVLPPPPSPPSPPSQPSPCTASHAHIADDVLSGLEDSGRTLLLPSAGTDVYCCLVEVGEGGGCAGVRVVIGECRINGITCTQAEGPKKLKNGKKCIPL